MKMEVFIVGTEKDWKTDADTDTNTVTDADTDLELNCLEHGFGLKCVTSIHNFKYLNCMRVLLFIITLNFLHSDEITVQMIRWFQEGCLIIYQILRYYAFCSL